MRNRSKVLSGASGYDVGDVKLRYAVSTNPIESGVITAESQEWLRTGYLTPYNVKYAAHLTLGVGRGLYAYNTSAEELTNVQVDYYSGRYYFLPDSYSPYRVYFKSAFDSAASIGTSSTNLSSIQGVTRIWSMFIIKSGANAGRVFCGTNGNSGYQLHYQTGALSSTWSDAGLDQINEYAGPRFLMGKPDGTLMVAMAASIGSSYGSGNIKTSSNGAGTSWTSRNSNLTTYTANPSEAVWCPTLDKFLVVGQWSSNDGMRIWSTADGFTWTVETGVPPFAASGQSSCFIADNGAATVVLGSNSKLYCSVGAGAFSTVDTPRQLIAIAGDAGIFYALNNTYGLEISTDNGITWTALGQINGPTPAPLPGASLPYIKVANDVLFYSFASGLGRFTTQPLPTVTPDKVGAVADVPAPSGATSAAHFVRIL